MSPIDLLACRSSWSVYKPNIPTAAYSTSSQCRTMLGGASVVIAVKGFVGRPKSQGRRLCGLLIRNARLPREYLHENGVCRRGMAKLRPGFAISRVLMAYDPAMWGNHADLLGKACQSMLGEMRPFAAA
jgi:hypothetical protein